MRTTIVAAALLCGVGMGCSKSEEPTAPAAEAPQATTGAEATGTPATPATESVLPTQPEATKVKTQVTKLQYPATREQILTATTQNVDLTASEKKWIADNLPAGTYGAPEEVLNALKVQ